MHSHSSDFCQYRLVLCVLGFHINGIKQYEPFYVWIFLLSLTCFRFFHVVACISSAFPIYWWLVFVLWVLSICLSIHLLIDIRVISSLEDFLICYKNSSLGLPGGTVVGNLPANAGDTGSSPGLGRSHMPRSN